MKKKSIRKFVLYTIICLLFYLSFWIGQTVRPHYFLEEITLDIQQDDVGLYYVYKDKPQYIDNVIDFALSELNLFIKIIKIIILLYKIKL